jgi:hypothetical protein
LGNLAIEKLKISERKLLIVNSSITKFPNYQIA